LTEEHIYNHIQRMLRPHGKDTAPKWQERDTADYDQMSRDIWNEQVRTLVAYLSQGWEQILEEQEEARAQIRSREPTKKEAGRPNVPQPKPRGRNEIQIDVKEKPYN